MRIVVIVFLVVFVAGSLASSVTRVKPGERAVVRRFGAILPEKPEPGLLFKLPWWMDRVDLVPVDKRLTISVGWGEPPAEEGTPLPAGQLLTGDHNLVNAKAEIHYRVVEGEVDLFVLHGGQAEPLIARATEAALAQWLAGRNVDDILLHGRSLLPSWLVDEVQERIAAYQLGIRIEKADVNVFPPSEVKPDFDAVSDQHTRIGTQIDEAKKLKTARLSEANAKSVRIDHESKAYASEQTLAAQGEAETFAKKLDQYRLLSKGNPDYLKQLWLDEATRLYSVMRESGRIDLLDHYIGSDGLNISQFPLPPRRK